MSSKNKKKNKDLQAKLSDIDKYFKSIPFDYVTLDNYETICYRKFGRNNKNFIIFLHGNLSGQRHWDPLFPYLLQNEKYTYITLDLRGFGRSTNNSRIENIEDFADDLKKFTDELDIRQFVLVGWSLGGGIAMQFTIKYPEMVKKMILMSSIHYQGYPPFLQKDPETKELERITDIHTIEHKSKRIHKNILEKDREFLKIFFGSMLVRSKKQWFAKQKTLDIVFKESFMQRNYIDAITAQHFLDLTEQMHLIQCPVLIYHGDTDVLIPIEKAKETESIIKRTIGKDNCVLITKKNCGHAIVFEHPKDFSRTLLAFCDINFKIEFQKPRL